jgi:hypothetical protein
VFDTAIRVAVTAMPPTSVSSVRVEIWADDLGPVISGR